MKSLTVILFLFASSPAFSCAFHSIFFGDDDSTSNTTALFGNIVEKDPETSAEIKPQPFFQFNNFKSQLKQWKEEKREQQKESSFNTSHTTMAESSKPTEGLKQK
ncbi:MAG: hypothetical protein GY744_05005 [Gammaproteobacteria bacterium]|nr:hypothetical protein [Gammaproteobacteria bacterium]